MWLAERRWQAVGADFSEVGIRKARELANRRGVNVEWSPRTCPTTAPTRERSTSCSSSTSRSSRRAAADPPSSRRGRRTGRHVPARRARQQQRPARARRPAEPAVLYTADDVIDDLDDAGLQVERAERVERPRSGIHARLAGSFLLCGVGFFHRCRGRLGACPRGDLPARLRDRRLPGAQHRRRLPPRTPRDKTSRSGSRRVAVEAPYAP
jgi:hypothetical protein